MSRVPSSAAREAGIGNQLDKLKNRCGEGTPVCEATCVTFTRRRSTLATSVAESHRPIVTHGLLNGCFGCKRNALVPGRM